MNGVVGTLVHYVSFMDDQDGYSCMAKLQNIKNAQEVFRVYCDHLHYHGWKQVRCDVINALTHEEAAEFVKDGISKYVILDVIET